MIHAVICFPALESACPSRSEQVNTIIQPRTHSGLVHCEESHYEVRGTGVTLETTEASPASNGAERLRQRYKFPRNDSTSCGVSFLSNRWVKGGSDGNGNPAADSWQTLFHNWAPNSTLRTNCHICLYAWKPDWWRCSFWFELPCGPNPKENDHSQMHTCMHAHSPSPSKSAEKGERDKLEPYRGEPVHRRHQQDKVTRLQGIIRWQTPPYAPPPNQFHTPSPQRRSDVIHSSTSL